jgi:Phosphatidylglycerophosphatase A and related proteins
MVGCLITFWGVVLTAQSMIIGFLLFRFFDIAKLGWIKRAEKFDRGWGVVADDVVAALCANIILRLLI